MKTLRILFLVSILALFSASPSKAQGIVQSVIPQNGFPGQQLELVIRASGVSFATGQTNVSLGQGISTNYVTVSNSLTLRVGISINANASAGPRDLQITSGSQTLIQPAAFEVIGLGSSLTAILEVVPAQTIYASDFDPNNPTLAPVLFRVTVMNDQQQRNLKVVFSLLLEGAGLLGKANKLLPQTAPQAVVVFDNRQFDSYEFSPQSQAVSNQVQSSGVLPSGNYTYRIEIFDAQTNALLATAEAQNTLTNQATDLVIIAPGNPMNEGMPPGVIFTPQPIFQWLSSANQFDLILYKLKPGQTNLQEILQSQPLFREYNITGNNFLYPLSAAPLEARTSYAWQLRAYVNTANGNVMIESPLHWFSYGGADIHNVVEIASCKVSPESVKIGNGETFRFTSDAIDSKGNKLSVFPSWQVIPSSDGLINSMGEFKAGNLPKTVVIVADYGYCKDYAVVEIKYQGLEKSSQFDLLYQLFGNPKNIKKGGE
jgi:hypothetical protein